MSVFHSPNHFFGYAIIEELRRLGVEHICIAPGSRSTPLVLGAASGAASDLAGAGLKTHVHHDERGLGYFALGICKASRQPVAVLTTSGTAVSNLIPAATEAFHSGLPLIFLTADRPPELRDVGSNQAINQVNLFQNFSLGCIDLPTPTEELEIATVLSAVDELVEKSIQQCGPVQINCPFREPLVPNKSESYPLSKTAQDWLVSKKPYVTLVANQTHSQMIRQTSLHFPAPEILLDAKQPLFFVSQGLEQKEEQAVLEWANLNHVPIAVDVLCHLRGNNQCLRYTDWTIENLPAQPDLLVWFGGVPQSKRVRNFFKNSKAQIIQVQKWKGRSRIEDDQNLEKSSYQSNDIAEWMRSLHIKGINPEWKVSIDRLGIKAHDFLSTNLKNYSEPTIARIVAKNVPEDGFLMSASSRPIRDLDAYAESWPSPLYSNRGASGIDGNIATFCGLSSVLKKPGVLLIGDLSTIHDLNSLSLFKQCEAPSLMVIVDNDGGGIFHFLPLHTTGSIPQDVYEKYFGTPHRLNLCQIIQAFEIPVLKLNSIEDLDNKVKALLSTSGSKVIYLKSNRSENHQFHTSLRKEWIKWYSSTDS